MIRLIGLAATVAVAIATGTPAAAQDHSHHAMGNAQSGGEEISCEREAERHRAMGHPVPEGACEPARKTAPGDAHGGHGAMQHSGMDHSQMDHSQMNRKQAEALIPVLPPPPSAGSGPPTAADAIWGAEAMRDSRNALGRDGGGMMTSGVILDRFEYRIRDGRDGYLWDGDAWYGGDLDRVWLESEGEGSFGEEIEDADIAILYGRAISPWFDLQTGVRQDLTGPARTYLDLGVQGLAPYLFEVEADLFLSTEGDVTARAEVELDQRVTQRLVLQPRAEIALAAQDVPELGIGAGLDTIEAGVRLRYEIAREFAPYVGIEQEWKIGRSADYAREEGEDPSVTNYVVGVRFWF